MISLCLSDTACDSTEAKAANSWERVNQTTDFGHIRTFSIMQNGGQRINEGHREGINGYLAILSLLRLNPAGIA